jgi:hypothetical protein
MICKDDPTGSLPVLSMRQINFYQQQQHYQYEQRQLTFLKSEPHPMGQRYLLPLLLLEQFAAMNADMSFCIRIIMLNIVSSFSF